jgi:hypothetical protein
MALLTFKKIYMIRFTIPFITVLLFYAAAVAQPAAGTKEIEKLCGCFNVTFKYAETFSPDPHYAFHEREELYGRELVLLVEQTPQKLVLQHLLLADDTTIIKHWREDWAYQQPVLFTYTGNKTWVKQVQPAAEVKGKWVQTVWEVDDSPRYQGSSNWVTTNNKTFWESTVDAPLPRREYTVRNDYNIMRRTNRIVLTDSGWLHEQDNGKIQQTGTSRTLLAEEKGINLYVRMPSQYCNAANAWWQKNSAFWQVVRQQWQIVLNQHDTLALKPAADGKKLYEHLDALWRQWRTGSITTAALAPQINTLINKFL